MSTYVLIIFMSLGYGQADIKFQEFNSLESCNEVKDLVKKADEKNVPICVKKWLYKIEECYIIFL